MRVAKAITLTDQERITLTKWARGRSTPVRLVLRATIVLAAADGRENKEIAVELSCTRRTVGTWRCRFAEQRLAGIEHDAPRGGRTPVVRGAMEAEIIRKTTQETPPCATQWSTRTMAKELGISKNAPKEAVFRRSPMDLRYFRGQNGAWQVCLLKGNRCQDLAGSYRFGTGAKR